MIITIHDTIVNKGRKTNMEIKKPYIVVQYNTFVKDVDGADQYLSYYSVLKKTVKWSKKGDTTSAKLRALQRISLCTGHTHTLKPPPKVQNFLHKIGRSRISEVQNRSESRSDDLQLPEKETTPKGPKQDLPGILSSDFRIHRLEKFVGGGEGKRKYPARQFKVCAAH